MGSLVITIVRLRGWIVTKTGFMCLSCHDFYIFFSANVTATDNTPPALPNFYLLTNNNYNNKQ